MRTEMNRWSGALITIATIVMVCGNGAAQPDRVPRILLMGDSWSMLTGINSMGPALHNKGFDDIGWYTPTRGVVAGSGVEEWAEGLGSCAGALEAVVAELQSHPTIDIAFLNIGFDIIFGKWKAPEDFDPPLTPDEYAAFEAGIRHDAQFGADGQHGLKRIFDMVLSARPDVKILFSSYDYVGAVRDDWDMPTVNKYNTGMEWFTGVVIDLINSYYKHPLRAALVNNLGLMQYTYGYPGPNPDTIPAYFWPPPGTPHAYRFGPGPGAPGQPPFYPGNEAAGYVPLAGGDPGFRISPYIAQLDPPVSGWVHLSADGFRILAEHAIDEYMAGWIDTPKVYKVERATRNPFDPTQIFDPVGQPQVEFRVTFNKPVTGVDPVDFEPIVHGGIAGASIDSVTEGKAGTTFTVTVNTGLGDGTLGLAIVDNDSIHDLGGVPLGGPGTGNGYFAYGEAYQINRATGLPLATWPAIAALLAAVVCSKRR